MGSPITPELVYHLKTVSDPCLSPDGSKLAFYLYLGGPGTVGELLAPNAAALGPH